MSTPALGRPLEDLIDELASGLIGLGARAAGPECTGGVRPVSVEFDLPVQMRVAGTDNLVVHAELPSTRTRTGFDRPLGRLSLRLDAKAVR